MRKKDQELNPGTLKCVKGGKWGQTNQRKKDKPERQRGNEVSMFPSLKIQSPESQVKTERVFHWSNIDDRLCKTSSKKLCLVY